MSMYSYTTVVQVTCVLFLVVFISSNDTVANEYVQLYNGSPSNMCAVSCALKSPSPIDLIIADR